MSTLANINPYSLYEVLIAKTVPDATSYEDPVQLAKDQMFTVTPVHDTDQQRDSGSVGSTLSVQTHGEVTIQAGGVPFLAGVVMMGSNTSTSGNRVTISKPAGINNPYFGAIGVAPTEDGKYVIIGLIKVQLQADPVFNFDGTTNAWITNELSALATTRSSDNLWQVIHVYDSLADWQADKPVDGAGFLALMTA